MLKTWWGRWLKHFSLLQKDKQLNSLKSYKLLTKVTKKTKRIKNSDYLYQLFITCISEGYIADISSITGRLLTSFAAQRCQLGARTSVCCCDGQYLYTISMSPSLFLRLQPISVPSTLIQLESFRCIWTVLLTLKGFLQSQTSTSLILSSSV